jgi:hypothetical protein
MKAHLFWVSYKKDFDWFSYSVRTVEKFGSGFSGMTVAVPNQDLSVFQKFCDAHKIRLRGYLEMPGKPFISHMLEKCQADVWVPADTDLVVHLDSDSIFVEKFSMETYLHEGLPILMRENFDDFPQYPSRREWKRVTDYALRYDCQWETMCRHPSVHWRELYRPMRQHIEEVHGIPFSQYVLFQKDSFAQSFCEFVTLGNYAIMAMPDRYQFVDSINTPGKYWVDPKWKILGLPDASIISSIPPPLHPDGRGSDAIKKYWDNIGWKPICLWRLPGGIVENRPYPPNPMRYYWSKWGVEKFRDELEGLIA